MRPVFTTKFFSRFSFLLLSLFVFSSGFAQNSNDILPKGFAEGEELLIPAYNEWRQNRTVVACESLPPTGSIRTMAEWEELQGLAITWTGFTSILTQIVAAAKEQCQVIIICTNDAVVKNQLSAAGVDWSTGITFIEDDYDSIWIRDYGPNSVYLNDVETLGFIDWIYNRPRPEDDVVPEVIADELNIPIYCTTTAPTDLVHTGGNFMADGLGMAFSSELVLEENDASNQWGTSNHSEEEVDQIMSDFMGIDLYPKMTVLPYDAIHHIDMHMKLLNETTLLVGEYPEGIADGPQIEANIQYVLSNYTTPYGTPYRIVRMPMPPEGNSFPNTNGDYRTYTNAVFVNKTILLPVYEEQYDTTAIRIWEEEMPGYEVIGIDCNAIIPLSGAIHCITKEIGTDNPLLITHQQLPNVTTTVTDDYLVEANIKHRDGINYAVMYYKTDLTADYTAVAMTSMTDDNWEAAIPIQPEGTVVYYYINAEANDGKQQVRPITAPEGYFKFTVSGLVSTNELAATTEIKSIFPNPAGAITCIPIQTNQLIAGASIELTDVLGRTLATVYQGDIPSGESKYFIDAAQYEAGTYFVRLSNAQTSVVQKLMIK